MLHPTALHNSASKAAIYEAATTLFAPIAYSNGLSNSDIEARVLNVLKDFTQVEESKISLDDNFVTDLGLDSLDTVEVIIALEEEFSVDIPDSEADEITNAKQAIEYISHREDAH